MSHEICELARKRPLGEGGTSQQVSVPVAFLGAARVSLSLGFALR